MIVDSLVIDAAQPSYEVSCSSGAFARPIRVSMTTIVGLLIVCGAVAGGYALAGGPFGVLFQPSEVIVIGGAAVGSLMVSAPGKSLKRVFAALKKGFGSSAPKPEDYLELLKLLFMLFQTMRRDGVLAIEQHVAEPSKSSIFSQFPSVLRREHAMHFLTDGLRQAVDGCPADELAMLLDAEMETHHDEAHQPVSLIRSMGDALPGLGIVAAVLGIVITMGHLDGGPEEIGHHVAAALVGSFLGILMCYGIVSPLATNIEACEGAEHRYMQCIKDGVLAAVRGSTPGVAVEFARRAIFSDERPSSHAMEEVFKSLKGGG